MTVTLFKEPFNHEGCGGRIQIDLESSIKKGIIKDKEAMGYVRIYCDDCDYTNEAEEEK